MLVGDDYTSLNGPSNGAVYLYEKQAQWWNEAGILVAAEPSARLDGFGSRVFGLPGGILALDTERVFYKEIQSFALWYEDRCGSPPPPDGGAYSSDRDGNGYPDLLDFHGISSVDSSVEFRQSDTLGKYMELSLPLEGFPMQTHSEVHTSSNLRDWTAADPVLLRFGPPRAWALPVRENSEEFFKVVFTPASN